ncbi:MAG: transglycosylase domain-containing protein, partial [Bacillota bacterium]|nr:transglycosylase domain-containing protein [Bacillota bacterium]
MSRLFFSGMIENLRKWRRNRVMVFSFSTMVLGLFGMFQFFSSGVDIDSLKSHLSQATVIYDQNGEVASKLSGNKNEGVDIKQIPNSMKHAVVAIEDRRFYEHSGVDFIGILRAFYKDVIAGEVVEGGSTITQQLAKNALLTSKRTFKRKIEEIFLAREIEKKYSKDEILQMYLNQIYFGDGAWGLKSAALKYYGKDVKDLTISESAMLAGLIKAPSALNPYEHLKKATKRRNLVLSEMKKQGFITKKQFITATEDKVALTDREGDPFRGKYPYYVDQVLDEAINQYG